MNAQCPFCQAESPLISIVHTERIWDCCDDLSAFIEKQDPNDETGLLQACYSAQDALADWQACTAFAAEKINVIGF